MDREQALLIGVICLWIGSVRRHLCVGKYVCGLGQLAGTFEWGNEFVDRDR